MLSNFANGNTGLLKKWKAGLKLDNSKEEGTYYFLDKPVKLKKPLKKESTKTGNRGRNWIGAGYISANRCVTFEEFVKRLN